VNARKYSKENRDRLVSMTDDELLAYERQRHGDPYMMVGTAKELRKTALKFWHLGRPGSRPRRPGRTPAASFERSCGRMDRNFV
jgi:hypothetical protein